MDFDPISVAYGTAFGSLATTAIFTIGSSLWQRVFKKKKEEKKKITDYPPTAMLSSPRQYAEMKKYLQDTILQRVEDKTLLSCLRQSLNQPIHIGEPVRVAGDMPYDSKITIISPDEFITELEIRLALMHTTAGACQRLVRASAELGIALADKMKDSTSHVNKAIKNAVDAFGHRMWH